MSKLNKQVIALMCAVFLMIAGGVWGWSQHSALITEANAGEAPAAANQAPAGVLTLTDTQLQSVRVQAVADHVFMLERDAVGNIAFNDEKTVQVYSPYAGRILEVFAKAGDNVKKGSVLFTLNSPDLVQAESTLIAAAGVRELTTVALARAKQLLDIQGLAQKDYEQAVSDQQSAEGAYNAARNAVRIFDIPEAEIDRIIATRTVNSAMPVTSPITGQVTARSAATGLLVQPGNPPAPFAVSDVSNMWMVANVAESDIPLVRLGQIIEVRLMAFPGRVFRARVTNIGATVDPNTHRVTVRSEVSDPRHELLSGMFATFTIRMGNAAPYPAVPLDSVNRESDGSMSVWVTTDGHRFSKRSVKLGMQQDDLFQILGGIKTGERIATEGAIFLSNSLTTEVQ